MRQYLLGLLPEEDAAVLERRYFEDSTVVELLDVHEQNLIDDYLQDRLSPEEMICFARRYLSSPRGHEKVRHAQAFQRSLSKPSRGWSGWLKGKSFRLQIATAGLAIVCLVLGAAIAMRYTVPVSRSQVADIPERKSSASAEVEIISFRLSPGVSRSSGKQQTLRIPERAQSVRLRLELNELVSGPCQVILRTAEAEEISQMTITVKGEDTVAEAILPASLLHTDDYILELRGSSSVLATFSFRVLRGAKQ